MTIYVASILEDSGILSAEAKAFRTKEEAVKFADTKIQAFLYDFPDSERRDDEDHFSAFNDDYLISADIIAQEI